MKIRTLEEPDAAAWWELRARALAEEPFAFGKSVEEHRATTVGTVALRFRDTSADNFTLGAFEGESLIGMMTFVRETGVKERHKGRIYGVYVAPANRGKGVGGALLCALLDRVQGDSSLEQILLAVGTGQREAQRLYRSFGFSSYGVEPNALKVGTHYVDEEHMILRLR